VRSLTRASAPSPGRSERTAREVAAHVRAVADPASLVMSKGRPPARTLSKLAKASSKMLFMTYSSSLWRARGYHIWATVLALSWESFFAAVRDHGLPPYGSAPDSLSLLPAHPP
jgi:hypothetical protein